MRTRARTLRHLCSALMVIALCSLFLLRVDARAALAKERIPDLEVEKILKWDPIHSPDGPHVYRVHLEESKTTIIGVVPLGNTAFRPKLTSTAIAPLIRPLICGGRPTADADETDALISCSPTRATQGFYEFTVSDQQGHAPTTPYAIFAKVVDDLSRIDTQDSRTKQSFGAYRVTAYEYLRVPTTSSLKLTAESSYPIIVRMYDDKMRLICEADATCAVNNPDVTRYYVVVLNPQEPVSFRVSLRNPAP
jgi:hypothetical protein